MRRDRRVPAHIFMMRWESACAIADDGGRSCIVAAAYLMGCGDRGEWSREVRRVTRRVVVA